MSTTEETAEEQVLATAEGDRDELLDAFRPAAKQVGKTSGVPSAFAVVRLRCDNAGVFAEASDGRVSVRIPVPLQVSMGDEWDMQVSPRIADVVRAISSGKIEISAKGQQMEIRGAKKSRYKLPIYSHQWPKIDFGDDVDMSNPSVSGKTVLELARASRFASEGSGARPNLAGVNIRDWSGEALIAGTDSFRLYTSKVADLPVSDDDPVTIPTEMIEAMASVFGTDDISLHVTPNAVVAGNDKGARVTCRRIDGKFPDPKQIIPKDEDIAHSIKVDRRFLLDSLERLAPFFQGAKPIKLIFSADELELCVNTELGEGHEFVDLPTGIDDLTIAFNPKHLLDGLRQFDSTELTLNIISPTRPMIVRGEASENRQFVVSTVRPV